MATPAVAGTLAVLRQYLTEGYYPTGEKLAGNAVANPSAALMKAMLINGAEPVYNIKTDDGDIFPLGTVPSMYQGWGMARMDTTLSIKGTSFFPSQIWDRQTVTNGEVKTIDLNFEPGAAGKELCVTLVYWDIVSWVQTKQALVNDLDLMVVVGGQVAFYPNGLAGPDRLNTVERVCLRTTGGAKAEYKIYVTGAKVTTGSQRFSLVASSRSVQDRKKPNCRTDVCNDFTWEGEITTIDKVTKGNWDWYLSAPSKYVELCEYTKKDACAAKKSCRWCSVGGAGRCHRKNLASASMCPSANPTTPAVPTAPALATPSPAPSSGGAAAATVACSTTLKNNNCNGCAAMSGCNWCTFGGGRSGCLKDSEKAAYTCTSSAAQCLASPIPGGIKIGLTPIAAINVVVASPPPPSPPPAVVAASPPPAAKKSPQLNTAQSPPPSAADSGAPPRRRETAFLTFLAALVVAAML